MKKMFRLLILLGLILPLLAQSTVSIRSFSVQQTPASVQVTLTFNTAISTTTGCFFDKLIFVSDSTLMPSTMRLPPDFPGICEHSGAASTVLTGTMDIRDYINAISFPLLSSASSSYVITDSAPVILLPGVMVEPISSPLPASVFTPSTDSPALVSFDLDLTTNDLLLHFNALMDAGTLMVSELTFSDAPSSQQTVGLTSVTVPSNRYTTTLCISLSTADIMSLRGGNICMDPSSCYCHFSSSLISDSRGNAVSAIGSASPQKVTKLRTSSSGPTSSVFMRLSLSYIGCTAVHTLAEDEVFVLRPFESVSSINCSINNQQSSNNIRPRISRETSFSGSMDATITDYVFYDWPLTTYLRFASGLPSELYGQYVCTSNLGTRVRSYVHNSVSNIELPGGMTYSLPLKAPLTIPLFFGTYPGLSLLQNDVTITLAGAPSVEKRNPYHVDIRYPMVENSLSGSYVIQISDSSGEIATRSITIDVTPPTLTLLPEVATILPGQTELELMCTVNSNELQVRWSSGTTELSSTSTYTVELPTDTLEYTCSAIDPTADTVEASGVVRLRNVQELLSVWQEGVMVINNSLIEVVNRRSGDLSLQCIEHVGASATSLTWMVLPDNGSLIVPMSEEDETYQAVISGNQANLTIDNSVEPFRGLLKCISSSGQVFSVRVVEDMSLSVPRCQGEEDSVWEIVWNETLAGGRDFQPCPPDRVSRSPTNGVVIRQCGEDGEWNGTIDVSDCSTESFINLQNMAQTDIFDLRNAYTQNELSSLLTGLINQLESITQPKATTYFPRDIDVVNNMLDDLVDILSAANLGSNHSQIVTVFDNLLRENNVDGWTMLSEMNGAASFLFLSSLEGFGVAFLESLLTGSATVEQTNIVVHAMTSNSFNQSVTYPANTDRGAQVMIPAALLQRLQANGVVYTIVRNIDDILPEPDDMLLPESNQLRVASTIVSTQITNDSGLIVNEEFSNEETVSLEIVTDMVSRATNPFCVFWDASENQWSQEGVETVLPLTQIQAGEIKQFSVRCLSNHLTAFGVAVDVNIDEFDFTIPVYVGCGCVIFSSVLSIFSLFLSWACDKLRRYSIVSFFIHMSFIASLLCAFIAFLAGIEQALNNRLGCAAVAGLLHYFFTAAFCWLLCEGLLLVFFRVFSQYCGLCLVMFILGWGLPAIPTAISLAVLHESYGTTTQCWFFFDGVVSDGVVLGFILPKLFIIAATLLVLCIGCCTNCKFSNKKMQPYLQASLSRVLWLIWASICIFLVFLIAVWVFALLLVNVYGIDSIILGWVFMIACIIMSVWMFVFSAVTMVINQKVDYERVWSSGPDPVYPLSDVGREKGYEFMSRPSVDLSGRRTSTLTRASQGLSNPVFGTDT